jgi:hypothetical protein
MSISIHFIRVIRVNPRSIYGGTVMTEPEFLDDIREQIQKSLAQSKRQQLRDEFGMQMDYTSPSLSPEAENEWLDYIQEFERQFENARAITVREKIGDPPIRLAADIPAEALAEALNDLLELLFAHNIVVDFLGNWDDLAAYRYITEELLDEETTDMHIEGMLSHFDAATPEYDVEMWVDDFARGVFWQDRTYFLPGLDRQPLFDAAGRPITLAQFAEKVEAVWARLPATNKIDVQPTATRVGEDEATVTAVITWPTNEGQKQVEASFRLQPSPYSGWCVVQTSLLEALLAILYV